MAYFPARTATAALTAFGLLAVMLAITGINGLAAYTGKLLLVGGSAGLAMGLASTRLLASIVYQATPRDPVVIGAVGATMALVTLTAARPARRAVSVDPIRSLRHE